MCVALLDSNEKIKSGDVFYGTQYKMHRLHIHHAVVLCFCICLLLNCSDARVLDFWKDFDSVPFDDSHQACTKNSALLGEILNENCTNNTLIFPENVTFNFHHGISARNIQNSVIQIDGVLRFQKVDLAMDHFEEGDFPACITIGSSKNITVTSQNKHRGLIDGRGSQYWGKRRKFRDQFCIACCYEPMGLTTTQFCLSFVRMATHRIRPN